MDFEDKECFYVSSVNRLSGTSSSFSHKFGNVQKKNYDSVCVLAASIPKSYYLITTDNDEFILTENGSSVDIHIPVGNYTISAWKNTLINVLNTNSPNNWTYSIDFNVGGSVVNTGKLRFSVSGNSSIQPQFTFSEYLYKQMGFNPGTYTFNNDALTSGNVINLQLLDAVFINSDICTNRHDSVLQEIYSNNGDYSNITYLATAPLAYAKKMMSNTSNVYSFYLTNVYGQPIDLNGLDWNCTVLLYKENKTLEMIRNYIKLTLLQ